MQSCSRGQAPLTLRHHQTACTVQLAKRPGQRHGRPGPDVQLHSHSDNAVASAGQWNKVTERLVGYSAIPFSILVLPQVIQNASNMSSGNVAALSIISWEVRKRSSDASRSVMFLIKNPNWKSQGYLSALMGNTLMCSHFANRGERSAVNVQLVGILNNMLVLLQARWLQLAVCLSPVTAPPSCHCCCLEGSNAGLYAFPLLGRWPLPSSCQLRFSLQSPACYSLLLL